MTTGRTPDRLARVKNIEGVNFDCDRYRGSSARRRRGTQMKSKFLITLLAGSAEVVAIVELYFGEKRAQQTATDSGLDGVPRHGVAHFGRLGIWRIQEKWQPHEVAPNGPDWLLR
jgi:hypothetical protein